MSGTESHLDDAHCADLVLGLATATERAAALAHAAGCAACEARLRSHVGAAERARPEALEPRLAPLPLGAPHSRRPGRWNVALAAAALLALAVAIPLLFHRPRLGAPERWLPATEERVLVREGEREDPHLSAGLAAYRRHDLVLAGRELSVASATGAAERMRRLYLAHVRLASGDVDGSLELLRGLDWAEIPEPWRREGVAVLAQALRHGGHAAAADSIERALRSQDPASPVVP